MLKKYTLLFILLLLVHTLTKATCTIDPNDFEYSMTITGELVIEGELSTDINDKVYAYVNDECRGSASIMHIPSVDIYIVMLTIYSNSLSGEKVTFKIMDDSSSTLLDCANEVSYESDANMGSPSDPYEVTYSSTTDMSAYLSGNHEVNCYPNPSSGIVNIELKGYSNEVNYSVYTQNGSLVSSGNKSPQQQAGSFSFDLTTLQKGVYFIQLKTNTKTHVQKIVLM